MNSLSPRQMAMALAALAVEHLPENRVTYMSGGYGSRRGVPAPVRPRTEPVVGRNEPCQCGSGKKSKKCCRTYN